MIVDQNFGIRFGKPKSHLNTKLLVSCLCMTKSSQNGTFVVDGTGNEDCTFCGCHIENSLHLFVSSPCLVPTWNFLIDLDRGNIILFDQILLLIDLNRFAIDSKVW